MKASFVLESNEQKELEAINKSFLLLLGRMNNFIPTGKDSFRLSFYQSHKTPILYLRSRKGAFLFKFKEKK